MTIAEDALRVRSRRRLLQAVERPRDVVANVTPNWFASVMGTGIVATAAAGLPVQWPGLRGVATVVWALSAAWLVVLLVGTALHWLLHRSTARSHHRHPVMAHFYGAPPMAMLTVGAGALLVGRDWMGLPAAVAVDRALWSAGTATGLAAAVLVPYLAFTRREGDDGGAAFGGWLMPIVPPMVSASTGALLLPSTPPGQLRETLLWACFSCFGLSLVASVVVIGLIWGRLMQHRVGPAAMVPTLWIVLGPIGQSITAVNLLAGGASSAVGPAIARGLLVTALVLGFAMLGFAGMWAAIAALITVRTARAGLPFSLTWWSFTFPVGTCVTGLNGLALHSGLAAVAVLAVLAFACLVAAWALVAVRTAHGVLIRGTLLLPPRAA